MDTDIHGSLTAKTTTTLRHYDTNNYDTISNHEEREGYEEPQMEQPITARMWDVSTGLQVFKLTSFQVDSRN